MRFFSKQGASSAIVARARTCSFASVSFPATLDVAKFLGRTAHAFADDKETRIAKLLDLSSDHDAARLPALPAPTLAACEESGALLVVWSPLVLAVAYAVELRPAGTGGPWVTVDVASRLGDNSNRFDSACSSCKVAGLSPSTAYEARVSYFTECGTRSEASEASDACVPMPTSQAASNLAASGAGAVGLGVAEGFAPCMQSGYGDPYGATSYPPPAPAAGPVGLPPAAPPAWPNTWLGHDSLQTAAPPPLHDGFGGSLPAYVQPPGWRSASGMVVPPPPPPELRAADEYGCAVSIQWPAVIQAAAYVVELREAGSTAFERFVRAAPEAKLGTLVELRVGGLRPGPAPGRVYCAQVRTVGADGSESAPSNPGWSAPLPSLMSPGDTPTGIGSTPPGSGGNKMSIDAAPFHPGTPTTTEGVLAASPLSPAAPPPAAPPPAAPPPSAPPSGPCLSNWAPPPWLGPQGPGTTALGPLDVQSSAPTAPPSGTAGEHIVAAGSFQQQWGVPGGPPPPPTGPPALVQPGPKDPAPEVKGHEECLILD